MFPVIQIGPLSIQSAGLFILVGFYFALLVTGNAAKAVGLDSGKVEDSILISAAAGLAEPGWDSWCKTRMYSGTI